MKKKFWLDKRKEKKMKIRILKYPFCHQNHDQLFPIYLLFLSTFAMPSLMIYA